MKELGADPKAVLEYAKNWSDAKRSELKFPRPSPGEYPVGKRVEIMG